MYIIHIYTQYMHVIYIYIHSICMLYIYIYIYTVYACYIYIYIIRFEDSLLGSIQTNLSSGPIHFDCFTNFTVSLHDPRIRKALTLNIKTSGTLMVPETKQLALIYRVYYKCIKTNLNIQALNKKAKGETTLISQIQIPKTLKWTEISFLQDWTLQNENYSF